MTGIVPAARAPGARRAAALPAPGQRGGCAHRVPGAWFSLWQPSWSPGQAWAVIPSSGLGAPSLTLRCQSAWRDVVAPAGDAQREVSGVRMLTQRPYQVSGRCRSLCKTLPPLTSLSSSERRRVRVDDSWNLFAAAVLPELPEADPFTFSLSLCFLSLHLSRG